MDNRMRYKAFHSSEQEFELKDGGSNAFGKTIVNYEIYKRTDVSNLSNTKGYLVLVKQRIIIPSMAQYTPGASSIVSYKNYPAIVENQIKLDVNNQATVRINHVFPRTLNSTVTTNSSSHTGTSNSVLHQNTTGSSYSNVNTFGVTLSGGFFGDMPTGDLALSYSHSWVHDTSSQNTTGGSSTSQNDSSFATSMSVKDWSAYSLLDSDNDNTSLKWIWGQSYPWDVILYNHSSGGENISLPQFVKERLVSDGIILPPSEISLFGLDFTSQISWLVDFPEGIAEDEIINITHNTTSYTASHEVSNNEVTATLQSSREASSATYSSKPLNLSLYALSTIGVISHNNMATIGFRVNPFTYAPKTPKDNFKIVSYINDLEATGKGFNSAMTTDFSSDVVVELYFKIEDTSFNYVLSIIHWLEEGSDDCKMTWTINDKYTDSNLITNAKSESRENSSVIPLRNLDYTSVNFYDYLVLGLNKIQLSITPASNSSNHKYTMSSIAIR